VGLFKKFKKAVSNPVRTVKQVASKAIQNPVRTSMAVTSGGLSELARKAPVVGNTFKSVQTQLSTGYKAAANIYTGGLYGKATAAGQALVQPGGGAMGFNLGGFLGQIGSAFGQSQIPAIQNIGSFAGIASGFIQPTGSPFGGQTTMQPTPVMASGVQAMARAGAVVGRGFFNKFPNLATAIQGYRNMGKNITRAKLHSLMRRFGPELLISGGILSAAAVSELMMAGPGRRRMNPGNVKALRRSLRRLESFDKLCHRVQRHTRKRSTKRSTGSSAATFVRQG